MILEVLRNGRSERLTVPILLQLIRRTIQRGSELLQIFRDSLETILEGRREIRVERFPRSPPRLFHPVQIVEVPLHPIQLVFL